MTNRRPRELTAAQREVLAELRRIVATGTTPLRRVTRLAAHGADLVLQLRLCTHEIDPRPGGLPVRSDHEDVLMVVPVAFPLAPPTVRVDHGRFAGHPHVLQGDRICLFLDTDQEWHPALGAVGVLNRLWSWLEDAASGSFDAGTALYHPVGGVLHTTAGTPVVVVREPLGLGRWSTARRWLHPRSAQRLDLVRHPTTDDDLAVAVVTVRAPLRYGAGNTLRSLCARLDGAGQNSGDLLHAVATCAARNPPGRPAYFLLAVAGRPTGAVPADDHLICGRVGIDVASRLRSAAKRQGGFLTLDTAAIPGDSTIEWCTVSEERPARTSRRDHRRPINAFTGSHVVLWGCGGIGSWAGEFLARAGATRLTLCDPAVVTGPLLVRQDFAEGDVGRSKAEALADRLRSVNDLLTVDVVPGGFAVLTEGDLPDCDAIIDATVNNTVAATIGTQWTTTTHRPVVARISTDRATCTLGLLTITRPADGPPPEVADQLAAQAVLVDLALEPYRCFWEAPAPADELNPAPGCSVPTYHGSAADLAAATGSMLSLLGPHLAPGSPPGSHLVALPHSLVPDGHVWLPAPSTS